MSELVHRPAGGLTERIEWARAMAPSNLLPKQYRDNPANLLFAIEYADALGIDRVNALTSIHVVEGKPTASADLIAGIVRRAGHKLRISGDDTTATAQIIRADDPEYVYEVTWTMDRARQAGLAGKNVWKQYPAAMLRSRAITEVARMGASDALLGVIYTPEELGAEVSADGDPVRPSQPAPDVRPGRDAVRDALHGPRPEPAPETGHSDSATMVDLMRAAGLVEPGPMLAYASETVGRELGSARDLTPDEVTQIIAALQAEIAGGDVVDAEIVDDTEAVES